MDLVTVLNQCDEEKTLAFPMQHTSITAASKRKLANVRIELPRNLVGDDVRDLNKWVCMVVAIDKNEYNRIIDAEDQS